MILIPYGIETLHVLLYSCHKLIFLNQYENRRIAENTIFLYGNRFYFLLETTAHNQYQYKLNQAVHQLMLSHSFF